MDRIYESDNSCNYRITEVLFIERLCLPLTFETISIIGGAGHVGLPLAIAFADSGPKVTIVDKNMESLDQISKGIMPFLEPGGQELLQKVLSSDQLYTSTSPSACRNSDVIIVVIGTPEAKDQGQAISALLEVVEQYVPHFRDGQLLVLRSTISPGTTIALSEMLASNGLDMHVAYCPERIAEHKAFEELYSLPQIVSGVTDISKKLAADLFELFGTEILLASVEEAEHAKLIANSWRYIKFAAANEFFQIASLSGLNFERLSHLISHEYPRAADLPKPGFAAGPCLPKDTGHLEQSTNSFHLGRSAIEVNEGLPAFVVSQIESNGSIEDLTLGILGMSFKAGSDDIRSSLSYDLQSILKLKCREVLCTDPHVRPETDPSLVNLEEVLTKSDIVILGAPHPEYRDLEFGLPVYDIWGITSQKNEKLN